MWFLFFYMGTSNRHNSACKTTQALIRAPLESPRPQLSNGARMSSGNVLHTELEPVENHPSTRSSVCELFQEKLRPPAKSATPKTLNPRYSDTFVASICVWLRCAQEWPCTVFHTCLCKMTSPKFPFSDVWPAKGLKPHFNIFLWADCGSVGWN